MCLALLDAEHQCSCGILWNSVPIPTALGAVPSPFDCFLCNRGLKTLHIRMKLHFHNGLAVAKFLESHPRVEKVIYPGGWAGLGSILGEGFGSILGVGFGSCGAP